MSGTTDPFRAIFERLVETAERKAKAKGKTIYKPPKKAKPEKRKERMN
jgi:hypothetical protein